VKRNQNSGTDCIGLHPERKREKGKKEAVPWLSSYPNPDREKGPWPRRGNNGPVRPGPDSQNLAPVLEEGSGERPSRSLWTIGQRGEGREGGLSPLTVRTSLQHRAAKGGRKKKTSTLRTKAAAKNGGPVYANWTQKEEGSSSFISRREEGKSKVREPGKALGRGKKRKRKSLHRGCAQRLSRGEEQPVFRKGGIWWAQRKRAG